MRADGGWFARRQFADRVRRRRDLRGRAAGTWGDATDSAQPSLELEEDGTLHRHRRVQPAERSSGSRTASTLTFENVAVDDDGRAPTSDTWLSGLDTAKIDGSTMTVYDESGKKLGTLERTDD